MGQILRTVIVIRPIGSNRGEPGKTLRINGACLEPDVLQVGVEPLCYAAAAAAVTTFKSVLRVLHYQRRQVGFSLFRGYG